MSATEQPTVVLVHGAFAESASWNCVIQRLHARGLPALAVANPLRSVATDGAYLRDVIGSVDRSVILVGHSYGGMVISEAAADNPAVQALVYVAAFAPEAGETAFDLSGKFPGSTLADALAAYPIAGGGVDLRIVDEKFHDQFCADLCADEAALMATTQRPVTQQALTEGLTASEPGWRTTPSWFVFGERDLNIPVALMRFMAERASSQETFEVAGASHAIAASQPDAVAAAIIAAVNSTQNA